MLKVHKLASKISERIIKNENLTYDKWIKLNDEKLELLIIDNGYVKSNNELLITYVISHINSNFM